MLNRTLLCSLFFIAFANILVGQSFEGKITFQIEYIQLPEEIQGMESMLPKTNNLYLRGEQTRSEQEVMGGSQAAIADDANKTAVVLMNMMGQKMAVMVSREEIEAAEKESAPTEITYVKETKKIAGYKCSKAEIKNSETGEITTIFYTEKLGARNHLDCKELKGFPLEYESSQNGMKMRMTATSVEKMELEDHLFTIPDDYEKLTTEEVQKMMGGE